MSRRYAATVTDQPAILSFDGSEFKLPVVRGTEDERAIDISKLRAETGLITLDPGYVNTGSCDLGHHVRRR